MILYYSICKCLILLYFLQEFLHYQYSYLIIQVIIISLQMESSKLQTEEQKQVKLLNQLYKLQHIISKIQNTIIFYDLYSDKDQDDIYLSNLHTLAQVLIDNSLNVQVKQMKKGKTLINKYRLSENQTTSKKINRNIFQIEEPKQGEAPSLDNIYIYEVQGSNVRVVVIPIQKDLIDITALREQMEALDQQDAEIHQKWIKDCLSGDTRRQEQVKWAAIKAKRFNQSCVKGRDKHLKMFRIQAFVGTVLQKTEKVSICSLVQISPRRHKQISGFQKQFNKIFNVPAQFKPQFIFHDYNPRDSPDESKQAENPAVTTVFSFVDEKFAVHRYGCLDQTNFFSKENIRTKIYQNMEKNNNKAIVKVIQDFVESFNKILTDTASCITSIVRLANSKLNQEKRLVNEDLDNTLTDLNSSKDLVAGMTFNQAFENYILPSLYLPQNVKLNEFYTPERLNDIQPQKGTPKIPPSIQTLTFIHFFYRINQTFEKQYHQKQIDTHNDQIQLLNMWKKHLKNIYELAKAVNNTFLNLGQNKQYQCKNMQRFFDFLNFTFEAMEKIKKITKKDLATVSSLKGLFDQLKPRKDKLLAYIIANQKSIRTQEPIHYYDLYLLIITQNASKAIQNDMQYIFLHIHELKAFRIASQYIYDNQKLVQAIKSYALIALRYDKLAENKKDLINILQIQRRMARLLKIIGQEESAAKIYFKNRQIQFADNCCRQVLAKYKGDDKAKKLIEWGVVFQKEFHFDLAQSYFRKAFSYARSALQKKNALQHTMACNEKIRTALTEEETRMHNNFLGNGDLIAFSNETKLYDLYQKLKSGLSWDNLAGCATILQGKSAGSQIGIFEPAESVLEGVETK